MKDVIKDRLRKVYELVNKGATEGEKTAAQAALDRLASKYNLSPEMLEETLRNRYNFTYTSAIEELLFVRIIKTFVPHVWDHVAKRSHNKREISVDAVSVDYITIDCAYEYFRRHMKSQWRKLCADELKKCRKTKTLNKRRAELQDRFFDKYCIASKLYRPEELHPLALSKMSYQEIKDRMKMYGIEGGEYHKQVAGGLYLGNG